MRIRGIKRGQTIELLEQIKEIPDGTEIFFDLNITSTSIEQTKQPLTDVERLARANKLFGVWKDQPELIEIFEEIDEQRHAYQGRQIDSIDNQENR